MDDWQNIRDTIASHQHTTHYFEVWLDYVDDLSIDEVTALVHAFPNRIIYLFRRADLEPPRMGSTSRRSLLALLLSLPVIIDLDITAQSSDLNHIAKLPRNARLITSYHNYVKTPQDLQPIIDTMRTYQPDVFKVASKCHSQSDAARLITLKAQLNEGSIRNIVVGMGEEGRLARMLCDIWGNELIFAAESEQTVTAPGQFTRQELEKIESILGENL